MRPPVRELFRCPSKQFCFRGGTGEIAEMRFHPEKPGDNWNRGTNCERTERKYQAAKSLRANFEDAPPQNRANSDNYQWQVAEFREIRRGDRQASYDSERNAGSWLQKPLDQTDEHQPETNRR